MNNSESRILYFNKGANTQNFGDFLPQLFIDRLITHPRVQADVYRLIGSVIEASWIERDLRHTTGSAAATICFWCCGMRTADSISDLAISRSLFFGARGPLTRDVLQLPVDTPLGDPGLLLPILHKPIQNLKTLGKTICIPHIHDPKPDSDLLAISGAELVVRPEIQSSESSLLEIVNKIVSASFVLTASLHGAIIAAAYGVPFAYWNNGHIDCPFKWADFSASLGIDCAFVHDISEARHVYETNIKDKIKLPSLTSILDCCPFFTKPSIMLAAIIFDHKHAVINEEFLISKLDRLTSAGENEICRVNRINNEYLAKKAAPIRQVAKIILKKKEDIKKIIRIRLGI